MPEIDSLDGSDWIESGFVNREATPREVIKLGTLHNAAGLPFADTISILDTFDVDRCRSPVHDWIKKPASSPPRG